MSARPVGMLVEARRGPRWPLGLATDPLNSDEVQRTTVEPGSSWTLTPWLDAALSVEGIPHEQSDRVPDAIEQVLRSVGSEVDRVVWGGGDGLESIRGKVYVRWRPDKPYNAVDYANIARRLFMRAAEGFPAGARFVMNRYRIDNPISSDLYVYPTRGREVPPSAPEAARGTTVDDLPPPQREPESGRTPEDDVQEGLSTGARVAIGVGAGSVAVGLGAWWWLYGRKAKRGS
jgi:hypothetical protein